MAPQGKAPRARPGPQTHALGLVLRALSRTAAAISFRSSSTTVGSVAAAATAMAGRTSPPPKAQQEPRAARSGEDASGAGAGTLPCVIAHADGKGSAAGYVTALPSPRASGAAGRTSREPAGPQCAEDAARACSGS